MSIPRFRFACLTVVPAILTFMALSLMLPLQETALAQNNQPTPTSDPTVAALQHSVDAFATRVAYFEKDVALNKQATEVQALKGLIPILVGAAILTTMGVGVGIASPFILARQVRAKIEKRLDMAVYRADPTYLPIYIPSHDFEAEARRLKRLGFQVLRPYTALTPAQLEGIVVYPARTLKEIEELEHFIKREQASADQVAFVIYSPGRIEGGEHICDVFDSVTFANNAVTIATHVYALARGLMRG